MKIEIAFENGLKRSYEAGDLSKRALDEGKSVHMYACHPNHGEVMMILPERIRGQVMEFAGDMEYKLSCNDHKHHWSNYAPAFFLRKIKQEVKELENALINREDVNDIIHECADVANFCMMLADNLRGKKKDERKG